MVAAIRATFHHGPEAELFDDPLAKYMLGPRNSFFCAVPFLRRRFLLQGLFRNLSSSLTVLSRSRFAEDRLEQAYAKGVRQYVILGAGFDTFALRAIEAYPDLDIYEVDTQVSQKAKQDRVGASGLKQNPRTHYVAVDFMTETVAEKLLETGFDSGKPAFVSWLGVTLYLTPLAVSETIASLGSICTKGSSLVTDFMDACLYDPAFVADKPDIAAAMGRLKAYTAARGEPILSGYTSDQLLAMASPFGWGMKETQTSRDHASKFLSGEPDHCWPTHYDHLLWLEKKEDGDSRE